ncbi:MAG: hypothetical protein IJ011_05490 [Clostridia bacterium]|nr:hypothetical protein [Clostridia bacterium]
MNRKCGVNYLRDTCRRDTLNKALEAYIQSCRCIDEFGTELSDASDGSGRGRSKRGAGRFPNIAGFCRYYRTGLEELETLADEFPEQIDMLYAFFEDEALNSGISPAVLSVYMKKRLGYDRELTRPSDDSPMTVRFEHDIYDDGE